MKTRGNTPTTVNIDLNLIDRLIFKKYLNNNRFTQDSPVYPEVWLDYFNHKEELKTYRADLILNPHKKSSSGELLKLLMDRLSGNENWTSIATKYALASSGESVAIKLTFEELIRIALPLTNWMQNYLLPGDNESAEDKTWFKRLAGAILFGKTGLHLEGKTLSLKEAETEVYKQFEKIFENQYGKIFDAMRRAKKNRKTGGFPSSPVLWAISRNRRAEICVEHSVPATKADASRKIFNINDAQITWAVLDTGIDARHIVFRKTDPGTQRPYSAPMGAKNDPKSNKTRIVATYDFTKFREVLYSSASDLMSDPEKKKRLTRSTSNKDDEFLSDKEINDSIAEIKKDLLSGRTINWAVIEPLLRIPHNSTQYVEPVHNHGTHVAGIIGACGSDKGIGGTLIGMCPGINLYDIRVLDKLGQGDEFNILAAIQFIRWLNNQKGTLVIHGVNLSFSMIHEVNNYACGQTPVCVSCERMVAEGTVVVAAAGNLGQSLFMSADNGPNTQGFRMVNITDPGNAESVITVGSTHSTNPHSYGVSYFSSKGPTGDGRIKPDLVAPGEKVVSASIDDSTARMDGTSMAAPHVSGAAALLMAKHRELIGKPLRIKKILCETATDLGRERYFQGCGMVDVLRAIQSV